MTYIDEFELAIRVGLPKYFIFENGKITGRKRKLVVRMKIPIPNLIAMGMEKISPSDIMKLPNFYFCLECRSITRHNNEGNCMTCEADYYANHYQPE